MKKWNGSKWIRKEKRLAIYLRDGLACAWCGLGLEEGANLDLDHLVCRSHGGGNGAENLVTACRSCNRSRQDRTTVEFAAAVAAYLDTTTDTILSNIKTLTARKLDVKAAKALIASRGSYGEAMASCK